MSGSARASSMAQTSETFGTYLRAIDGAVQGVWGGCEAALQEFRDPVCPERMTALAVHGTVRR